ncbi:hypothetical protein BGM25_25315 [Bacillus sp. FJAT-29953]|nr:hypothetical protein [Bacillus sp. FJAT-29953]
MKSNALKGYRKLRDIYENNLTVELLSEEIKTCEAEDDAVAVKKEMFDRDFDIYGVNQCGKLIGYVKREDIKKEGIISEFVEDFHADKLISDSTSLIDLLDIFQEREFTFILEKNKVTRIVTVADLQKQPIRMLAFSFVSLLEMYIISVIKEFYPDDSWADKLTESRLTKAKELLEERLATNEALTLVDNLQLSDKGTIIRKTPKLVEKLGFESNSQCKEFFRKIEELRNNTAHSQEKIYHDYKEFIHILLQIERVLSADGLVEVEK